MASISVFYFLLLRSRSTFAATVEAALRNAAGNTTILNDEIAPAWADSPSFRGTSDILWSCIVTIFACVYTAINLNVPDLHKSKWRRMGAKVKWALIALCGPELVLYIAMKQLLDARRLCKSLNDMQSARKEDRSAASDPEDGQPTPQPSKQKFDLSYGFCVVMGGFVVDVSTIHDELSSLTLQPAGVELLARNGHFIEVSKSQISDRSKADFIAKSLVCVQVSWMLVQCIARKAAGYPLTLLEIHTMVHVFCALCIYVLWWHKPLDIQEPIPIDVQAYMDLIALMTMAIPRRKHSWWVFFSSEMNSLQMYPSTGNSSEELKENSTPSASQIETVQSALEEGQHQRHHVLNGLETPEVVQHFEFEGYIPDFSRKRSPDTIFTLRTGQSLKCGLGPSQWMEVGVEIELSSRDVRRWELGAEAIRKLDVLPDRDEDEWKWENTKYEGCERGLMEGVRRDLISRDRFGLGSSRTILNTILNLDDDIGMVLTGSFLPLLYGGVHLTALNFKFPSNPEAIMWKISGLSIMVAFPLQVSLVYMRWRLISLEYSRYDDIMDFSNVLLIGLYAFFRLYIVVEAFLSLRSVPLGVYAAVPWVQSLPHL